MRINVSSFRRSRRRGEFVERSFALLRGGRDATLACARTRKHSQAATDPYGRVQSEPDSAQLLGAGTPREWKNRGGMLILFAHLLFARESLNGLQRSQSEISQTKSFAGSRRRIRRWQYKVCCDLFLFYFTSGDEVWRRGRHFRLLRNTSYRTFASPMPLKPNGRFGCGGWI